MPLSEYKLQVHIPMFPRNANPSRILVTAKACKNSCPSLAEVSRVNISQSRQILNFPFESTIF